jgi:shikimate 5-dehydrogenase
LEVFAKVGENFDLGSSAIVVGAGAMARVLVAVLFREGFKEFGITALDEDRGVELIRDLRKIYFGAEFEFIPKDELILLPGLYGFIANTTPSTDKNELLAELSYFNFFIPRGVALDLYLETSSNFLKEAKDIGATIITGHEVAAAADAAWAKWAFGVELDQETYLASLKEKFQSKV